MKVIKTNIPDLLIFLPDLFKDKRGYFFESYNKSVFNIHDINCEFVQDNESMSQKGVLRGLHFQNPPYAQTKLVRIIKGAILDVSVDIRKNSPTYGKHFITELTEHSKTMVLIPQGFAHGFLTLEDNTIFSYKCTKVYNKSSEDIILWNDPDLNINWGIADPIVSDKDRNAKTFKDFNSLF